MYAKKKSHFSSRFSKFENSYDTFDVDRYDELVDDGHDDKTIAKELNVNETFLQSMKKDINKMY